MFLIPNTALKYSNYLKQLTSLAENTLEVDKVAITDRPSIGGYADAMILTWVGERTSVRFAGPYALELKVTKLVQ